MVKKYTILVADRNRHVREFLRRELTSEGYRIRMVSSSQDVLQCAYDNKPLDLLILDPDLPDADDVSLMEKLNDRIPSLPVIVHSLDSKYDKHSGLLEVSAFVEKTGNSVERLKNVVAEVLRRSTMSDGEPDKKD